MATLALILAGLGLAFLLVAALVAAAEWGLPAYVAWMEKTMSKADYVRGQSQTRDHHCHWPGCTRQVPPAMWGCRPHWYRLPAELRQRIWRCYQPGQEITGRPSAAYVEVAREAQAWIAAQQSGDLFGEPRS
jgi:hypothetical protein